MGGKSLMGWPFTSSPLIFTVASKPILCPAPSLGAAWSRMSSGPFTISRSLPGSQFAATRNMTSFTLWTSTSSSTMMSIFVHAICPAPQIACMTRRACSGYSFLILMKAQLWKQPNMGRS